MKRIGPPAWMELLLRALLPSRDRDTVTGDLHEEWCDRMDSRQSSMQTGLWYLLQTLSFTPRRCLSALNQPRLLASLCAFTALCGCWLGAMDFWLRHAGYLGQAGIAVGILLQALLTLAALHFRRSFFLRRVSIIGCVILFWLAGKALVATIRGAALEGYILLIAVALLFQATLTLCILPKGGGSGTRV